MILAGYFTTISRFTWIFAHAMWIILLEFSGAQLDEKGRVAKSARVRACSLGFAGLLGGLFIPELIKFLQKDGSMAGSSQTSHTSLSLLQDIISNQSLLWYRLLPN